MDDWAVHPTAGSHLPSEATAPPFAVATRSAGRGTREADAATALMNDWAVHSATGRIFLRKMLLRPSRSHSLRRLSRIPSRKAVVAPVWDLFRGSLTSRGYSREDSVCSKMHGFWKRQDMAAHLISLEGLLING